MTAATPVFVVSGIRTPILKSQNRPGHFTAADLAVHSGRALLLRYPQVKEAINEVILGCVMPAVNEANIARIAALRMGLNETVPAWTVQRNCASGMQAIDSAAAKIRAGKAELVLAGGVEAMSHAPLLLNPQMTAWLGNWACTKNWRKKLALLTQIRPAYLKPVVALLRGLTDPVVNLSMGQTAENIARRFGISRQAMDEFALESHYRLARAQDNATFDGEIEPLYDSDGKAYLHDDGLRRNTDANKLAMLKPVFDRSFGQVTAGNSAQISDGCAWLLLASEAAVARHQLPVLGQISEAYWAGLNPAEMGLGPVRATAAALKQQNLQFTEVDYWEINEAFAGQVLACLAAWEDENYCREVLRLETALGVIDRERLNVDGGAIACGHPVGMSGARIVLHLLNTLNEKNKKHGLATLCIGGGMGGAMVVTSSTAGTME